MRKGLGTTLSVLIAAVGLAGCQPATAGDASPTASASATVAGTSASADPALADGDPALLSITPASGSTKVRLDRPVTVSVVGGEIDTVTATTADGTTLKGEVDDDTGTWQLTTPLSSATTYTVTATATGEDGAPVDQTSTFTTARVNQVVSTTLIPGDDWVVGVGMPIVVVFSQAVKNREAAEAGLSVTSTPAVEGAWRWFSATEVHWRPREYWPSGATVHVAAAMSDVELAQGIWGKRTTTSDFTIGKAQIMTVNTATHQLTMERNGTVVKKIPVTTGKSGYLTRNGIKVVMSRESQVRMDAASLGTDKSDPEYYNLLVN